MKLYSATFSMIDFPHLVQLRFINLIAISFEYVVESLLQLEIIFSFPNKNKYQHVGAMAPLSLDKCRKKYKIT